jgi:hypothetical protein
MSADTPEPGALGRVKLRAMSRDLENTGWQSLAVGTLGEIGLVVGVMTGNLITCAVGLVISILLNAMAMHCFRTRALLGKIMRGELL